MTVVGLVSRVSPVQTALRNCTRDEGRPFEVGNQVLISSHRKLLLSKANGGERCGNIGTRSRQARLREASASELLQKCRKRFRRCQNRGVTLPPGSAWGMSRDCSGGIRHVGSAKRRNSLAQAMPQTPDGTAISVRHAYAVAASGLISTA